ncbi:DUF5752 family protein [Methylomonas sp. MgM2]
MTPIEPAETQAGLSSAFAIRDCALIAIAPGAKALTLKELRNNLAEIHPASIYYHFWGSLLQARFEEHEYNNDFAAWARHSLHDAELAERLALIDPTEFENIEDTRHELIEIIDQRLDESERLQWLPALHAFEFIQSQIVVFDTRTEINSPEALADLLPGLSTGSIFYHFIDARRRSSQKLDDFSMWLAAFGDRYADLIPKLSEIDPYFGSLAELRNTLARTFSHYFRGVANESA